MIAHSLDELIGAVEILSARVAAIDGQAPVLSRDPASSAPDDSLREDVTTALSAMAARIDQLAPSTQNEFAQPAAFDPSPLLAKIASLAASVDALEGVATAQQDLAGSLRLCIEMARESEARTARLEQEAAATHATIATVMPAIAAIARR